jgi:outer membrane scaffolding protein for murein synthesis (MipA/OmpV family)
MSEATSPPRLLLSMLALLAAWPACANPFEGREQGEEGPEFKYLLGAALSNHASYFGAQDRETKLVPVWAIRRGRWQINSSGAATLMGLGRQLQDAGANADIGQFGRVRFGLGLRVDTGRKSADSPTTVGLPDVRRTVRGRIGASYKIDDDWRFSVGANTDLLNRGGGSVYSTELNYRLYQGLHSTCSTGLQAQAGSGTYMRSFFGTPSYTPGAGLRDIAVGVNCNQLLSPHWILFGSFAAGRLLGPAADSPLNQKSANYAFSIGLAWRN